MRNYIVPALLLLAIFVIPSFLDFLKNARRRKDRIDELRRHRWDDFQKQDDTP